MENVMTRLMLVDDEPLILSSLRRTLNAMSDEVFEGGLQIETFETPKHALERAKDCAFDLVISDYRMPVMDGVAFLEALRELQPNIARLILSGYADLGAMIGAVNRARIFRFIAKPWDPLELELAIRQALEHRNVLIENQSLADLVRVQKGELSRSERAMIEMERRFPGLTKVKRDADGGIELDLEGLEDSDLEP
jgi:two-component system, probable response regulator PhcQ